MKDSATPFGLISIEGAIASQLSEVPVMMKRPGEMTPYSTIEGSFEGLPAKSIAVVSMVMRVLSRRVAMLKVASKVTVVD